MYEPFYTCGHCIEGFVMNTYSSDLLRYATKLDALLDGCGELSKYAHDIVECHSEDASFAILRHIVMLYK